MNNTLLAHLFDTSAFVSFSFYTKFIINNIVMKISCFFLVSARSNLSARAIPIRPLSLLLIAINGMDGACPYSVLVSSCFKFIMVIVCDCETKVNKRKTQFQINNKIFFRKFIWNFILCLYICTTKDNNYGNQRHSI